MFLIGKGFCRHFVGIQCRHMKAQSMQFIWAPELMIAVVLTSFIVRGDMMNFSLMYKEFFHLGVLWTVVGSSYIEAVLLFKNPGCNFLSGK